MKVRAAMSPGVVSVAPGALVAEAMRRMLEQRVSGLPVLGDDGRLLGIVSEGDFLHRAEIGTARQRPRWLEFLLSPGRLAAEYVGSHGTRVDEIMTRHVHTVEADLPLAEAVAMMERHRVKRLPVIEHGRVIGMLSRSDLLRAYVALAPEDTVAAMSDDAIAARIDADMARQSWCPREHIRVAVAGGTAELNGVVTDERTRDALRVLVENVAGVRRVLDHLTTIEPLSGAVVKGPGDGA